jgi:hypothetical protein
MPTTWTAAPEKRSTLPRTAALAAQRRRQRWWLDQPKESTYGVHMKRVTATEARKQWFRLLDEVTGGEVVVIERGGSLVELRRREVPSAGEGAPDYSDILRLPDLDQADRWHWEWKAPGRPLAPRKR